jgi:hypothetical protein
MALRWIVLELVDEVSPGRAKDSISIAVLTAK